MVRKEARWISLVLAIAILLSGMVMPGYETQAATKKFWNKVSGVYYNGNGKKIPNVKTRGIDVSHWQGAITWSKVAKSNVDFAFISAGYTSGTTCYKDSRFNTNMKNATAAGIPVGVYYYSKAKTITQAKKEANFVINAVQGYKVSYPIVFDLEDSSLISGLSNTQRSNIVLAFCNQVKASGYYPMLYCNTSWYNNRVNKSLLSGIDKWFAAYGDKLTGAGTTAKHTIWQATDGNTASGLKSTKGLISGIPSSNTVDINFGYTDYTKVITPRTKKSTSDVTALVSKSAAKKGWSKTSSGTWYYYKNGKKVTGWLTYKKNRYYFNSSGKMLTGLQKIGNRYYYFTPKKSGSYPEGAKINGWKKIKKKWYFFRTTGSTNVKGSMVRGAWQKVKGKWYYLRSNGVMKTGWLKTKGKWYYLTADGSMKLGWLKYKGKYYYLKPPNGDMAVSTTLTIDGKKYKFRSSGVWYK